MKNLKKVEIKNEEGTVGHSIDSKINFMVQFIEEYRAFDDEGAQDFIQKEIGLMAFEMEKVESYFKAFGYNRPRLLSTERERYLEREVESLRNQLKSAREEIAYFEKMEEVFNRELGSGY